MTDGRSGRGVYTLGKGLYSSPSRAFAAKYGRVVEVPVSEGWPVNPLMLDNVSYGAYAAFMDWALEKSGLSTARAFNARYPDPASFVKSLGYDGIIAGNEVVRYPS